MNKEEQIYVLLLILSIPIGYLFKRVLRGSQTRAILSAFIGFVICVLVCQYDIFHSLILIASNSLLIVLIHPK